LYDRWSRKYDQSKHASQLRDDEMLAQPLLEALNSAGMAEPFVLDFATGTGRLSYALISRPEFQGHIIALDLSEGMLEKAASKLNLRGESRGSDLLPHSRQLPWRAVPGSARSVELLRHLSLPLPFPNAAFDVVCALEVLELFPSMDEPLAELTRVLRPGGILLTSRGTEESGRKAKVKNVKQFTTLLERNNLENIQVTRWWKLFDRVMASKHGSSPSVGPRQLSNVLLCSVCSQTQWQSKAGMLKCENCGRELTVTSAGVVLN
jgi:ubiquinone/menaquinone biosynthesis C-methylase UbiE